MEKLVVYSQTSSGGAFVAAKLHAKALALNYDVRFIHPKVITFYEFGLISLVFHTELFFISKINSLFRLVFYRKEFGGSFSYIHWKSFGLYFILNRLGITLVNLHWQGVGFFGFQFSRRFKIIQTLHDEYVLTGGCHYMLGCQQFRICNACPQTRTTLGKSLVMLRKKRVNKFMKDVRFHVLSSWLENKSKDLFRENRIFKIPNPVIKPPNISHVKDINYLVIFSSMEPRKGANWLRRVLNGLELKSLVEIGPGTEYTPSGVGSLSHESTLKYIARARFVIFPSYFENLSNVIQEALSFGAFVICRPIGGNKDLISEGLNGYFYNTKCDLETLLKKFERAEVPKKQKAISLIDNSIENISKYWQNYV